METLNMIISGVAVSFISQTPFVTLAIIAIIPPPILLPFMNLFLIYIFFLLLPLLNPKLIICTMFKPVYVDQIMKHMTRPVY